MSHLAPHPWDSVGPSAGPDGCWPWVGAIREKGYGHIGFHDGTRWVNLLPHRVAYELLVGPIPEGLCVCHACDNPPCCNPAHLWLGTKGDNNRDMAAKGRASRVAKPFGSRHGMAKLTEQRVIEIRRRRSHGERVIDLAREFGVNPSTITRVVQRHRWTHAEDAA